MEKVILSKLSVSIAIKLKPDLALKVEQLVKVANEKLEKDINLLLRDCMSVEIKK